MFIISCINSGKLQYLNPQAKTSKPHIARNLLVLVYRGSKVFA